jgi:hypothetical protein
MGVTTKPQLRQPIGTPVGGQFAGKANPEPAEDVLDVVEWDFGTASKAAWDGSLPPDFDQWDLADDKTGWTVAHAAARSGHLPPDFDRWDLADKNGLTVRQVAESKPPLREHDLESPLSQRA